MSLRRVSSEDVRELLEQASDRKVARMLTKMMGPKVVHLPKLRQVPASVTAPIYVFENGIEGRGPLGYQPDVFGAVPGEKSYSPLHEIHLVRWKEGAEPREFRAANAIQEARNDGQLRIQATGTVINAPVLAWPGERR